MGKAIFFCDLDQTMIYSNRMVRNHSNTYNGLAVVETYKESAHSFMTLTAANTLVALRNELTFVPCTTRSVEQYDRVSLPGGFPETAILDNGGKILVNGVEDEDWNRHIHERISSESATPGEIYNTAFKEFGDAEWFEKIRLTSDMFVAVVGREEIPQELIDFATAHMDEWNYKFSVQSRSIYMIPNVVTKEYAAQEITNRYGAETTFASGDSVLDLNMMLWADHAIRPAHGELSEDARAAGIKATTKLGVEAGEQIVEAVNANLNW